MWVPSASRTLRSNVQLTSRRGGESDVSSVAPKAKGKAAKTAPVKGKGKKTPLVSSVTSS
jgi:hypothetical protein